MRVFAIISIWLLPSVLFGELDISSKVKTWELKNGLKVSFVEEHKAPVVTVQVFYHVGGKDEPADKRGMAHLFEHMMFKGSKHVAPEDHARFIDSVGGNENAFTMDDVTAYHNTIPPAALAFTLQLEAERMRNLSLTQKTIDSEREVVKEELRLSVENNPIGKAVNKITRLAYKEHPYRFSPIGEKEMLDTVTIADCQKFYDMYYRPNNATIIVAGDTDEKTVRAIVDKYFGKLERGPEPVRTKVSEPKQTQFREEKLKLQVQVPVMIGAYHIPEGAHPDIYVLEVIQQLLSAGESSRLYKRLVVKERLALAAGGVVFNHEDPGLFVAYAAYLPNQDAQKIRQILDEEIRGLGNGKIEPLELKKAQNQLATRAVFGAERVSSIGTGMGVNAIVFKNPMRMFEAPKKYDAVTADDIRRVAQKYFTQANYSLLTLIPEGGAK